MHEAQSSRCNKVKHNGATVVQQNLLEPAAERAWYVCSHVCVVCVCGWVCVHAGVLCVNLLCKWAANWVKASESLLARSHLLGPASELTAPGAREHTLNKNLPCAKWLFTADKWDDNTWSPSTVFDSDALNDLFSLFCSFSFFKPYTVTSLQSEGSRNESNATAAAVEFILSKGNVENWSWKEFLNPRGLGVAAHKA